MMSKKYDIIVVGAGHAGVEAALSASRMGCRTVLVTLKENDLGQLSCNPAIGGLGKGQLVKEIDALGGELAKATDYAGIQFRVLNSSKGAAVQSSRAQVDRDLFSEYIKRVCHAQEGLTVHEGAVIDIVYSAGGVEGVRLRDGDELRAQAVILTPGTFLNGLIHIGLTNFPGGRIGDSAVTELSESLTRCGFRLLRFKTGTCARLDANTIDYSVCEAQYGDKEPRPFSFETEKIVREQVPCYVTYTNPRTHDIIRAGLDRSPLYSGVITGTGVRYCPSIEDKIMRFSDRDRHQIFLEPEGLNTPQVYPNGISTSLPEDVQMAMIHSIAGLEKAHVRVIGYGIEHDVIDPTQLLPTLESKLLQNLYCAGQINGTTGYEEAGAQGLLAGINAALRVQDRAPFILDRSTSYIGVLIDDLVTKGTQEPYRMFTSRVEYRLIVREDNADLRLSEWAHSLGLLSRERYARLQEKRKEIDTAFTFLRTKRLKPTATVNAVLARHGMSALTQAPSGEEFLRRPNVTPEVLAEALGESVPVSKKALDQVVIQVKYAGYIERQLKDVEKYQDLERVKIPTDFEYAGLAGLSKEIQEKLMRIRPVSLGQASRISGVTPAAIMLLMIYLKKK